MMDVFLKVAYAEQKKLDDRRELTELFKRLPNEELFKIATGQVNLSGCPISWVEKFDGTPLLKSAVLLEQAFLQPGLSKTAEDKLRLQKRLLDLELGQLKTAQAEREEVLARNNLSRLSKIGADTLAGGKAEDKGSSNFSPKQMAMGKKVEMEHTHTPALAEEIARDHLTEIPDYYTRLKKMEDKAKEGSAKGPPFGPRGRMRGKPDATGPEGKGPGTGLGLGPCKGKIKKANGDGDEMSGRAPTPEDKKAIRNFISSHPGLKDEDYHEFLEERGVKVPLGEATAYALARKNMAKAAAELQAGQREKIKEKLFAVPKKGGEDKYPIHDLAHARNALVRVRQFGTPAEKAKVYAAVTKKYPALATRSDVVPESKQRSAEKRLGLEKGEESQKMEKAKQKLGAALQKRAGLGKALLGFAKKNPVVAATMGMGAAGGAAAGAERGGAGGALLGGLTGAGLGYAGGRYGMGVHRRLQYGKPFSKALKAGKAWKAGLVTKATKKKPAPTNLRIET